MINIKLEEYEVTIDLPYAGMYTFWSVSASGKTYAKTLLKTANSLNKIKALCLTYDDNNSAEYYISKIVEQYYDVVVLDRFDLYVTKEIMDALVKISDKTIVLMDLKSNNIIDEYGYKCLWARVEFGNGRLEISL